MEHSSSDVSCQTKVNTQHQNRKQIYERFPQMMQIFIGIQESVESIIARKAEEAGKLLDAKEEEYVRLQVERNQLLELFPDSESRAEEVLKRIQQIKNRIKKLSKGRPKDDLFKIPFKSAQPKSAAERKSAERRHKSLEAREREREDDRKRKASPQQLEKGRERKKTREQMERTRERMRTPENMEKTKERMRTQENMEKTKERLRTPENMEKTRQRLKAPDYRARDADRKWEKRREKRIGREKEDESPRVPQLSDTKAPGGGGGNLKVKLPSDDLNKYVDQFWDKKTLSRPTVEGPTYSIDQPLRIRVEFTCYPPPTIVWLKDGKVLARDTIKFAPREGVTSSADCKKERVAPKSHLRFQVESYYRFKLPVTSETVHMPGAWGNPKYKEERRVPPQLMQQGWSDFVIPEPKPIDEGIYEVRVFNSFGVVEDFIKVKLPLEFLMVKLEFFWTILLPCR